MRPDAGPIHPNPEAIVLISTCFQQQNAPLTQGFESNIKSERSIPKLIICLVNITIQDYPYFLLHDIE